MITTPRRTSGFTAVELLITLFVAAAFLIAAYQLFNLVVKDGGLNRAPPTSPTTIYVNMQRPLQPSPVPPLPH
jgi:prepilin-type N-terminal cleavage/methylation domain-containing protein